MSFGDKSIGLFQLFASPRELVNSKENNDYKSGAVSFSDLFEKILSKFAVGSNESSGFATEEDVKGELEVENGEGAYSIPFRKVDWVGLECYNPKTEDRIWDKFLEDLEAKGEDYDRLEKILDSLFKVPVLKEEDKEISAKKKHVSDISGVLKLITALGLLDKSNLKIAEFVKGRFKTDNPNRYTNQFLFDEETRKNKIGQIAVKSNTISTMSFEPIAKFGSDTKEEIYSSNSKADAIEFSKYNLSYLKVFIKGASKNAGGNEREQMRVFDNVSDLKLDLLFDVAESNGKSVKDFVNSNGLLLLLDRLKELPDKKGIKILLSMLVEFAQSLADGDSNDGPDNFYEKWLENDDFLFKDVVDVVEEIVVKNEEKGSVTEKPRVAFITTMGEKNEVGLIGTDKPESVFPELNKDNRSDFESKLADELNKDVYSWKDMKVKLFLDPGEREKDRGTFLNLDIKLAFDKGQKQHGKLEAEIVDFETFGMAEREKGDLKKSRESKKLDSVDGFLSNSVENRDNFVTNLKSDNVNLTSDKFTSNQSIHQKTQSLVDASEIEASHRPLKTASAVIPVDGSVVNKVRVTTIGEDKVRVIFHTRDLVSHNAVKFFDGLPDLKLNLENKGFTFVDFGFAGFQGHSEGKGEYKRGPSFKKVRVIERSAVKEINEKYPANYSLKQSTINSLA
ncbi:hypothetical protein TST_0635 [Thermosulfidibacter takaii ABI70S6]|uniref:Uncharacterized protein n=2 Tax=Thermosulfidibacter takaii TaxID=412593 RepID=A0A0S3QT36_THET7|nr:hypothetical protein TST_0635 [Thermosulfidibacter takaii ABI70S6]